MPKKKKSKNKNSEENPETPELTPEELEQQDLANYDPKEHWDNYEIPAETPNNDNNDNNNTTNDNNNTKISNSIFTLMIYVKSITILLVGVIALSLVVSALFGENTPFYSVVKNINVLMENLNSFSGFIVLLGLTAFFTLFYKNN
jgi:hypothetical protein